MKTLMANWSAFWFAPSEAWTLGVCRAASCSLILFVFATADFSVWGDVGSAYWMPVFPFSIWHVSLVSSGMIATLAGVWRVALLTSALGLFTRLSTVVAAVVGVYLLGMASSFGKINHSFPLLVFIMSTLAVSRCGDAFSLDHWLKARLGKRPQRDGGKDGEYTWPIRLVWFVMVMVFFGAGISKLRHSGIAWAAPENLARIILASYYGSSFPWNSAGLHIAQSSVACLGIGIGTLVLEIGAPVSLFSRRLRPFFVGGLFLMQVGIQIIMGAGFLSFLAGYVFWIPWSRLRQVTAQRVEGMSTAKAVAPALNSS